MRQLTLIIASLLISVSAMVQAQGGIPENQSVIWIGLAHDSETEATIASELRSLIREHDVERWILTRKILVDETQIPHSHPILTVHTRSIGDGLGLLATFVHEQLHWLEAGPWAADFRAAMAEFEALFPEVPSPDEGGARDRTSTYRHLLVCDMEYQAVSAMFGEAEASALLARYAHYEWIYDKVLNDRRIREIALRHGFDVSEGIPR